MPTCIAGDSPVTDMGLTDRFGGAAAWDVRCIAHDALWIAVKRENPGCGTCLSAIKCPDCGAVYCTEQDEWVDEYNPPCDYEGYERRSK